LHHLADKQEQLARDLTVVQPRYHNVRDISVCTPGGGPGGGSFTWTFARQMKEGSGNGVSLIKLIWAPFLDPDYVRSRICGQSGTSVKDQGSHDMASEYGAQRACFKA
jgi:hypothetical protein